MKKNRIWVAAGALLQLLYIAAACWHCWNGRLWEAVGMIAFGWTGCMIFVLVCMRDATLDALNEELNELDELWDAGSTYMERAKALMDAVEAEAMKCGILSHPLAVCPKCGGTVWPEIGGRMECVRCGEPLPMNKPEE